jgi:hypothetical protein
MLQDLLASLIRLILDKLFILWISIIILVRVMILKGVCGQLVFILIITLCVKKDLSLVISIVLVISYLQISNSLVLLLVISLSHSQTVGLLINPSVLIFLLFNLVMFSVLYSQLNYNYSLLIKFVIPMETGLIFNLIDINHLIISTTSNVNIIFTDIYYLN